MKTFKKLLAVLLSVLMIASVIVVPAVAEEATEETVSREVSIFDLSSVEFGALNSYPTGMDNYRYTFAGQKTVVALEDGEKGLKIDTSTMTGSNNDKIADGKYANLFGMKIDIPAEYIPYVTDINIKLDKQTSARLIYNFGVGSSSEFSKRSSFNDKIDADLGDKEISFSVSGLLKLNDNWFWSNYGTGTTSSWNSDFTFVYFAFGAETVADENPYVTIKDISIVLSGSADVINELDVTQRLSVWDLSANALGTTTNIKYAEGTAQDSYSGAMEIVKGTNGKEVLRLDYDKTTFTIGKDSGDRYMEHTVRPLYIVRINGISEYYIPFIEQITLKVNKQSSSKVLYNFGVTDGSNYSKNSDWNPKFADTTTGAVTVTYNVDNLYKCGWHQTGAYSEYKKGSKWDNDFTGLYLATTATEGATGYLDIEDIIITMKKSANDDKEITENLQFAADKAEYLIEDYENNTSGRVIESDLAVSGKKLQRYTANNGYNGATGTTVSGAENYDGISFWVYNDSDTEASKFIAVVKGANAEYRQSFKIAPRTWRKIYLEFNAMYKKTSGDDWHGNSTKVSLTDEEKAAINHITFRDWNRGSTVFYIDDIYFWKDNAVEDKTIQLTEDNVTLPEGATFEDGKVKFAPGVANAEVTVSVPAGTLSGAETVEYHYTTSANANPTVKLYMRGPWINDSTTNWSNWAQQIKRGEKENSGSLTANTTAAHVLDFTKTSGSGNQKVYTWYHSAYNKDAWMETSSAPSEERKSAITNISFRVHTFSEVDSGEYVTLNKLVVTYPNPTYTATAGTVENGTVNVFNTNRYEGDEIGFTVVPNPCYATDTFTVTDAEGNAVETTKHFDAENLDNYYTFKQPASAVTVSATFSVVPHTEVVDEAVDPDCVNTGLTAGSHCSVCNTVIVPQTVVDALGHTDGAPVDNGDGTHTVSCTACSAEVSTTEHVYVDGKCECEAVEPAIVYTFGHTMQVKAVEPWGMYFNAYVYNDDVVVDYDTLSDYGMYIAPATDFEGVPTAEELAVAGKAFTKSNGKAEVKLDYAGDKYNITVTYDEALYTYELDKEYYAVFYVADKNGNVSYGEVKTRSFNGVIDEYQNNSDSYSATLIELCNKMDAMYEATTAYREGKTTYTRNTAEPETVADYTFGAAAEGSYKFGHTMQLASIEPWALIFNAAVRVDGAVIDYSACDDYGMIISDKAFTSVADVDASAYVYNKANGGATLKGDYISVDYLKGISTSEMGKEFYAMFYVVIDGQYYYGAVKTRSMMSVAQQYYNNSASYQTDVFTLLDAMVDLYDATVAHKAASVR